MKGGGRMGNKTEYYKLAERIANDIECLWWCCANLPNKKTQHFASVFYPSRVEQKKYKLRSLGWMGSENKSDEYNNNFRILALLFMDQYVKDND